MSAPCTLSGGAFQDSQGNVLANGYLKFQLSQDGSVTGSGNIASGVEIQVNLDANGNVVGGSVMWGNDVINPPNTFYRVTGYTAQGQPAWGPNNQQIVGASFNLSTWVPNQVISWTQNPSAVTLETNGVLNSSQFLLNLLAGSNMTLTDTGLGAIRLDVLGVSGLAFPFANVGALGFDGITTSLSNCCFGLMLNSGLGTTGSAASLAVTGTEPAGISYTTASTANSSAGLAAHPGGTQGNITLGVLKSWMAGVKLTTTAGIRLWIGLCAVAASAGIQVTQMAADAPNFDFAGFRYSTAASDAKWKCITQIHGASVPTQTINAETGSHLDTNMHVFEIQFDGVNVNFYIDGTKVGSQSTNVLPSSEQLVLVVCCDNVNVAVTKSFNLYSTRMALAG